MKITKETISRLNELGYNVWGRKGYKTTDDGLPYKQAENLVVVLETNNDFIIKDLKTPKEKEVTVEWVLDKISKENRYKSLYEYLQKIADKNSISIYPASYGIGVASLFNRSKDIEMVSNKLHSLGLKFKNELSQGGWVYRFIVSKDSENMRVLESLKSA